MEDIEGNNTPKNGVSKIHKRVRNISDNYKIFIVFDRKRNLFLSAFNP
jgi:hypothetical protein